MEVPTLSKGDGAATAQLPLPEARQASVVSGSLMEKNIQKEPEQCGVSSDARFSAGSA